MRLRLLLLPALCLLAAFNPRASLAHSHACTGAADCHICHICNYCRHCSQEGGHCGVCAPAPHHEAPPPAAFGKHSKAQPEKSDALFARYDKAKQSVTKRFTPAKRAQIAQELNKAEDRAANDADQQSPVTATPGSQSAQRQQQKHDQLNTQLEEKYKSAVRARYKLTYEEMTALIGEANDINLKQRQKHGS